MPELWDIRLQGTCVSLRPLHMDDAEFLAHAAAENRQSYLYNPVPEGPAQARDYIERALQQRASGERIPFAVLQQDRIVGTTSFYEPAIWQWPDGSPLQRTAAPDVVEIGYTWLAHSAQRTRCNTEAKFLLLSHAFETWQVHRVAFRTDERNRRSRSALERLGAQFEGVRRAHMPSVDGTVRNSIFYSIIRSEWPDVREHLQTLLAGAP